MKSSKRKNVSKSSTQETNCDCYDAIGGSVFITLVVVGLIGLACHLLSGPKYEEGDCLLNRVGETLEVKAVQTGSETYHLAPQKYIETFLGYTAITDYAKDRVQKDIEFVDEEYIEVPCNR